MIKKWEDRGLYRITWDEIMMGDIPYVWFYIISL